MNLRARLERLTGTRKQSGEPDALADAMRHWPRDPAEADPFNMGEAIAARLILEAMK